MSFWNSLGQGIAFGMYSRMYSCWNPFAFSFMPYNTPMHSMPNPAQTFYMVNQQYDFTASKLQGWNILGSTNNNFLNQDCFIRQQSINNFSNFATGWNNCWNNQIYGFNKPTSLGSRDIASKDYSDNTSSNYSITAQALKQKWDKKSPNAGLTIDFFEKVVEISERIKCSPEDLMAVMHCESAGTFKPSEWNHAGARAVGLIQFTDGTAGELGTTLEELEKMTALEQLEYVEKFFLKVKAYHFKESDKLSAGDLYALVYLPGLSDKDILARKDNDPEGYYAKNKIFDFDKDGVISKSDLASFVVTHRA